MLLDVLVDLVREFLAGSAHLLLVFLDLAQFGRVKARLDLLLHVRPILLSICLKGCEVVAELLLVRMVHGAAAGAQLLFLDSIQCEHVLSYLGPNGLAPRNVAIRKCQHGDTNVQNEEVVNQRELVHFVPHGDHMNKCQDEDDELEQAGDAVEYGRHLRVLDADLIRDASLVDVIVLDVGEQVAHAVLCQHQEAEDVAEVIEAHAEDGHVFGALSEATILERLLPKLVEREAEEQQSNLHLDDALSVVDDRLVLHHVQLRHL